MDIKRYARDWFYGLQIFYLSIFQPSKLFERINNLPWYQGLLEMWVDEAKITPKNKILELGSATGTLSEYLSKRYKVTSVDMSPKMIERAKNRYPHIDFQVANASNLPFENETFDVVLASSLINVVDNKQQVLSEMLRVCKRGGSVILLFPLDGFTNEELSKVSIAFELEGFSKMALKMWHKLAKKISLDSLELLSKESNFYIDDSKKYLNGLVLTVEIKHKRY
jgi:ubiquinone/menaquinone biosynthesis C-methylase UbiE